MKINLSEADKKRIEEAVKQAETKTAGEIVPYLKTSCSDYPESAWKSAFLGGVLGLFICYLLNYSKIWLPSFMSSDWFPLLCCGIGAAIFILFMLIPSYRRMIAKPYFNEIVSLNAMATFTNEEVFKTRDRTGILIFISLFEHKVEIIGDEGINSKVKQEEWQEAVNLILQGIKSNNFADGLVNAINFCGNLLERNKVEIREDDTNELKDGLRMD